MYLYIMTLKSDLEARSYQLKSVAVVFFFAFVPQPVLVPVTTVKGGRPR